LVALFQGGPNRFTLATSGELCGQGATQVDLDTQRKDTQQTALHMALTTPTKAVDPNQHRGWGRSRTQDHPGRQRDDPFALAILLIQAGSDCNLRDNNGRSAFWNAVRKQFGASHPIQAALAHATAQSTQADKRNAYAESVLIFCDFRHTRRHPQYSIVLTRSLKPF
jgi:ankyrin repeat protein